MLAQLEELDGVEHAQTDLSGDYLQLTVSDLASLAGATEMLRALGYVAEPAADIAVDHWYDRNSVTDLSRVEAGVIADRVVPALRLRHALADDVARSLRAAVIDALHRCFVDTALTSQPSPSLRAGCVGAIVAAAAPIVGPILAQDLAALVAADMAEDHRQR